MKFAALVLAGASLMAAQSQLDTLVDAYFNDYFKLNPSAATASGFHRPYDMQLEDYSRAGIDKQIALDEKYLPLFENVPQSDERDLVISNLHADLLDKRDIRNGRKIPISTRAGSQIQFSI